jgi:hypothetical protein
MSLEPKDVFPVTAFLEYGGPCDKNISSGSNQSVNGILMHAAVHLEKE